MNWGKGIVIAFVLFIAMIFLFIYLGSRESSDLVSEDYYAQELQYEDRIIAIRNVGGWKDSIQLNVTAEAIILTVPLALLPAETGSVDLFRPSSAADDKLFDFAPDATGKQFIPRTALKKGSYVVKLKWEGQEKTYYWEKNIIL